MVISINPGYKGPLGGSHNPALSDPSISLFRTRTSSWSAPPWLVPYPLESRPKAAVSPAMVALSLDKWLKLPAVFSPCVQDFRARTELLLAGCAIPHVFLAPPGLHGEWRTPLLSLTASPFSEHVEMAVEGPGERRLRGLAERKADRLMTADPLPHV